MSAQLRRKTVPELMVLYGDILTELTRHDVIRSRNAPTGDYAEWLVMKATGGERADKSAKSWDVCTKKGDHPNGPRSCTKKGEHLQVKARVVLDEDVKGQRALSVFRSSDFDALVIVLFNHKYEVWKAAKLPLPLFQSATKYASKWVNGDVLYAADQLLKRGTSWTTRLRRIG